MNSSNFCLFTFANSIFILLYSGIKCKGGGSGKKRESFTEKGRENQFPDFPCLFLSHALIQLFRPVAAVGIVRSIAAAISITASVTVLIRAIAVLIFILVLVLVFVLILALLIPIRRIRICGIVLVLRITVISAHLIAS